MLCGWHSAKPTSNLAVAVRFRFQRSLDVLALQVLFEHSDTASTRHEKGQWAGCEQVVRNTAEDELPDPAVAIGTHHQQVGIPFISHIQQDI